MDGIVLNKRQVVFCPNAFDSTQKIITEIDGSLSFREIYNSLTCHPEEYAVIIDGDQKVLDFDIIPKSDNILIKIYPAGWFSNTVDNIADFGKDVWKQYGSWKDFAYLGGAFALGGVAGALSQVGWNAFQVGANMYAQYVVDQLGNSSSISQSPKQRPELRGGSNRARHGGRVGLLLGKHLINPDIAGNPHISISADQNGADQFLHVLFCGGYNNIEIDTTSYKIGDKKITNDNFPDSNLQLTQAGYILTEYNSVKIAKSVGKLVEYSDYSETSGGINATTATNTRSIEIFITFPNGLCRFIDGGKTGAGVYFAIEYKNAGETVWNKTIAWCYVLRMSDETVRYKVEYTFDNLTAAGADYNASRQYDIRVRRTSPDAADTDTALNDEMYFDVLQCTTGVFNNTGGVNTDPIPATIAPKLTLFALKVKATDTVNGTLESFNFIGQSKVPVYSGTGSGSSSWSTVAASSNPAALFLYVVRDLNINKNAATITADQINWSSFESWYSFCETKGLECNAYITNDIVLEELLNSIASCGRATWGIVDGKFNIIYDNTQSTSVQFFTPRNSWGFAAAKSFEDKPVGLRIRYINQNASYAETEAEIFYDDAITDGRIDDYTLFGVTFFENAWKQAKYLLACQYLRTETFSFNADIEHIICSRWDRISISHDAPLIGLHAGRVKTVVSTDGNVTGVTTDERVIFEPSKTYGVIFRDSSGIARSFQLTNPATSTNIETDDLVFATPYPVGTYSISSDDLFMFGIFGSETLDLIVTDIELNDDYSAKITCIPYIASVYTWDGGTPPVYDPKISIPGDSTTAVVTGIPVDAGLMAVENSSRIGKSNNFDTAVTVTSSTTVTASTNSFIPIYPFYDSNRGKLIYFNNLTGTIYEKSTENTDAGTQLVNDAGYVFCIGYYVRCSDGYICDYTGAVKVSVPAWCPQVDSAGNIYYINVNDGCIYKLNPVNSATTKITTYALKHLWMNIISDSRMLIWDDGTLSTSGKKELVLINTSTGSYVSTAISDIGELREFQVYEDNVYMSLDADFNLNKISGGSSLLFIPNVSQYDAYSGNIFYTKLTDDRLYKQYKNLDSAKMSTRPYIRTATEAATIAGNTINGSNIITGISPTEMAFVEIGDCLSGAGIPFGAYIETVDEDNLRIILNCNATATATDVTITVASSRLILDAATSILSKSVLGTHIKDGAISNAHLSPDSVLAVNIQNGVITNAKITTGYQLLSSTGNKEIGTGHIAEGYTLLTNNGIGEIGTAHLYSESVTETKIGAGAVTEGKVGTGAITTDKIAIGAVTAEKIGTGAVIESKIGTGAVTADKIGTGAVTETKIANGAITHAKIADNAIEQHNMADGSVGTNELIDLNVTTGKIAANAVTVGKLGGLTNITNGILDDMYSNNNSLNSDFSVSSVHSNPAIDVCGIVYLRITTTVTLLVYLNESRTNLLTQIGYSTACLLLPGTYYLEAGKNCTVSIVQSYGSTITYHASKSK